ncbi:type II toxin-antitoxin system mRNA interferase toxin, RelE/StbE family [Patescibacteria group bacterium]|nr:type II toxin-antitoxin system mRNA interferase toxin, RelE/StbE family [Patescibacteria group bacterium]
MKIQYHKEFKKNYKKRIAPYPKLEKQFQTQLKKLLKNSKDPSLRDHKLIGKKKNFRSFSVTGDIRAIYIIYKNNIWLYDIGSHN